MTWSPYLCEISFGDGYKWIFASQEKKGRYQTGISKVFGVKKTRIYTVQWIQKNSGKTKIQDFKNGGLYNYLHVIIP